MVDDNEAQVPGAGQPGMPDPGPVPLSEAIPEPPAPKTGAGSAGADRAVPMVETAGKKPGFLSTTVGKIVVIAGAVFALAVVAGAAFFIVVTFVLNGEEAVVQPVVPPAPSEETTAAVESEAGEAPEAVAEEEFEHYDVDLEDVFVFRNPFVEALTPVVAEATGTTSPGTGTVEPGTGTQYQANTLYLLEIGSSNGEPTARFVWDGTEYTVGEGDQIGSSPWRVLSIGSTSATMQYGDNQLSLSVGQAITK